MTHPAFDLGAADSSGIVQPLGDVYPLAADAREAAFAGGARDNGQPPFYPTGERGAAPLYPLSYNSAARQGEARSWLLNGTAFDARS